MSKDQSKDKKPQAFPSPIFSHHFKMVDMRPFQIHMTKPSADSAVEQGEKPIEDENQQHSIGQHLIADINHAFETLMHTETWGGKIRGFQVRVYLILMSVAQPESFPRGSLLVFRLDGF